jgi:hypothetical protein
MCEHRGSMRRISIPSMIALPKRQLLRSEDGDKGLRHGCDHPLCWTCGEPICDHLAAHRAAQETYSLSQQRDIVSQPPCDPYP